MIPVLYSMDVSWPNPNHDVFEMFIASVVSLCINSSEPLDLVVVCRGFSPWQYSALELASTAGRCRHKLRIYKEGDEEVSRLDDIERGTAQGRSSFWPKCVLDRLAVREFFQDYDRAFFVDMDVISRADLSSLYHELEDDVFLESVPDPDQAFNMCHGKPYPKEPQICCGFTLCNLKLFPTLSEFIRYYMDSRIPKDRDWIPAEQEALAYYAYDHGFRMRAFDPAKVTHISFFEWDITEEAFKECYGWFGVEDPKRPTEDSVEVYHFTYTSRDRMFYDENSFEHRFYRPYQRYAERIINGLRLSYPFIPKEYARKTEVQYPKPITRSVFDRKKYRTIVMSNKGSGRWYDFVLPSVLSASVHTKDPIRLVMLEGSDCSTDREKDHLVSVLKYGNRSNAADFRIVMPDTKIMSDSFWTPVHLHKLFAADILQDIDDYCLFMDSDVLVVDDLSPLFNVCDVQPDRNKIVGTLNWYHFVARSDIPTQLSGGFFFMHPWGRAVSAVRRMEFVEYWNANDEYVLGQCTSPSEFVNIGNACMEAKTEGYANGTQRLKRLADYGIPLDRVFAVHFLSSREDPRFNRLRMRKDFRRYVDDWFLMRDVSKRIAFGGLS